MGVMRTCSKCTTTNSEAALFCAGCGEILNGSTRTHSLSRSWDLFALMAVVLLGTVLVGLLAYLDRR